MNRRIEQLDSIRGLAALAVVLSHIPYMALSLPFIVYKLLIILRINNGHSSVMLFFVLSGFVLALPFLKEQENNYLPYIIKRFFRIYVPYIFAITLAIILSQIFLKENIVSLGDWDMLWSIPVSLKLIFEHIFFIGNIHSNSFNGPIWSLIHELRISLVFPFIVFLIKRVNWKITIIISLVLSCISGLNNIFNFQESNGYNITYFHTIHFVSLFILGALLAKHKNEVITVYKKLHRIYKWLLLFTSLFIYQFSEFIVYFLHGFTNIDFISTHFWIIVEYGVALGSVGLIVSALGSYRLERILLFRPILFLGKISYSLYLYHLPIILGCFYLLHYILPLWLISIIGIFLSVCIASVAWKLVEQPSINIGKLLAKKLKGILAIYWIRGAKRSA
ncbi:acyltransferase family protein [Fredinandcohnia humi]